MARVCLDSLIRVSPDAIVATDKNGKITLFNQGAERLMGYKAEEMIGKPAAEFYSKEEVARELMQEMYKGKGEVVNYETAVRTKIGEIVPVLISASQLKDEKGEVAGTVGFVKDIAEKKRVEEELRSRNMELAVLNEISMLLSQSFDLEEGLNKSLDIILKMMSLDAGLAYLIDEHNKSLILSAHRGVSEEFLMQEKKFPLTLSDTLAGKIAQSGEPIIIDDYPESPLPQRKLLVKEGIKSAAFIPFRSKEKTLGTMIAASRDYRKFTEQEVKFLSSVAHQMGIAIQNAKFLREWERERDSIKMINQELSAVNEIGWAMSQALSLKEVMDIALTKATEITGMDAGAIRLLDERKEELVITVHKGLSPEFMDMIKKVKLNENESIAGAVALSKKPLLIEDTFKDPRTHKAAIKEGIKSVASMPLLAKGKVVGTLDIGSYSFHSFHPRDKEFFATIGNQIGIFIENVKLYAENEKNLEESLALYRMSQILNSTRTSQEAYEIAMELVKSLFNATAIAIFLYDGKQDLLKLIASIPSFGKDVELRPNQGIAGEVFITKRPTFVSDVVKDSNVLFKEDLEKKGFRSAITLPIMIRNEVIGVLQVFGEPEVKEHTQKQIELLEIFSTQIGIAIERTKYEEQLRFLASIPSYSPYGLFTVDNNRIITSWNKGAEDIYGWKEEEVIGRSVRIIAPDDDMAEGQERNFEKLIKEGILRAVEIERVRKDGSRVPVELTSWAIKDEEGKIIGYTGLFRDLTEIKKMQEELDRRQRELFRSEKLASIGSLAAGACHEILNPLNIISGYTQLLLPKYKVDSTFSKALKTISEQCQRIEKITKGLTLFSRKGEIKKEPIDLKEVILSALALVEEGMRLDNIKTIKRVKGPLILEADRDQLSQVILGLINNARDALHGKAGTIEISTDTVERNGRKEVLLSIADTGEGIKEEHLGKIFDPFFTTKPVGKGTGLGLSVAYGIIADHGGSIEVESKVGEGSTFKVFLPLSKEELTTSDGYYFMKNILIIDDEPLTCELYKEFFEGERYRVDVVHDGNTGLSKLREGKYSLVLLDIRMPGMSGLEVLEKLREEDIETKVIIITGVMERDMERKCLSLGAAHLLTKPISLQNLKEVIGKTIKG